MIVSRRYTSARSLWHSVARSPVMAAVSHRVRAEEICSALLAHVALLAVLFSGLGLARACGYVLVSVRSARRQAPLE